MTPFFSPYRHDFVRFAACVPSTLVADPTFNVEQTLELLERGDRDRIALMVFPELGLSSYAIDDLLQQDALLEAVQSAVAQLVMASKTRFPAIVVGAPLRVGHQLYNVAIVIHAGRILGIVPKGYLPNYREFYERRHFAPGIAVRGQHAEIAGITAPFGVDCFFGPSAHARSHSTSKSVRTCGYPSRGARMPRSVALKCS